MKKLLFTAAFALTMAATSFAAAANKIDNKAASNFSTKFSAAKNVRWTVTEDFIKASFTLADSKKEVFYDLDGNTIGTSSNIEISEIPAKGVEHFEKKYAGYTILETTLFEATNEIAYFIFAENATKTLILKVLPNGSTSVFKHTRK